MSSKLKVVLVTSVLLLGGCSTAPPSLFEVQEMCMDGNVKHYKVRTKELTLNFKCKDKEKESRNG